MKTKFLCKISGLLFVSSVFVVLQRTIIVDSVKKFVFSTDKQFVNERKTSVECLDNLLLESDEGLLQINKHVISQLRGDTIILSPLVVPKYKLVLFWNAKVASTYWKFLLRHIQNMSTDVKPYIVHHPDKSNLESFYNYSDTDIIRMMYNDSWTKTVFVREPRERFLSAYIHKIEKAHFDIKLCKTRIVSFGNFVNVTKWCRDPHWETQVKIPTYFYKTMLVGKMENLIQFTEMLLTKIGAFSSKTQKWLKEYTIRHPTHAEDKIRKYYTPELEREVINMYQQDFDVFNFSKATLL